MAALAHVGLEHGPSIAALCHDFDPETDGCSDRRVALAIFFVARNDQGAFSHDQADNGDELGSNSCPSVQRSRGG
jgi:hypothetical protein